MMPSYIDTHCHLTMPHFDPERPDVIKRARDCGLVKIITIGTDLEDSRKAITLAQQYDFIYAAAGIHPHDVSKFSDIEGTYGTLKSLASERRVVAIGETGLDYHYLHSPPLLQQEHMRRHLEVAGKLDLPVIIHSREAQDDTLKILREERSGCTRGVFHCFSGDIEMAQEVIRMGFYISFSGVITFRNAGPGIEILKSLPRDRILVETDAPYLTPHPHRGKRNEPAYVIYTEEKVAEIWEIPEEEACGIILKNAMTLFRLEE